MALHKLSAGYFNNFTILRLFGSTEPIGSCLSLAISSRQKTKDQWTSHVDVLVAPNRHVLQWRENKTANHGNAREYGLYKPPIELQSTIQIYSRSRQPIHDWERNQLTLESPLVSLRDYTKLFDVFARVRSFAVVGVGGKFNVVSRNVHWWRYWINQAYLSED